MNETKPVKPKVQRRQGRTASILLAECSQVRAIYELIDTSVFVEGGDSTVNALSPHQIKRAVDKAMEIIERW